MYTLSTSGVEIELIFALRAVVFEIRADFQNSHIWAWNLANSQSSRRCTYTLFLPQGIEIELIFALRAAIYEIQADFQNCHTFGHETCPLAKVSKVAHILSFYPRGSKLILFSLYGQRFLRYGWFSNLQDLGMILGHRPKFQKLHMYSLPAPRGRNWAYFWSMGSGSRDTGRFSKLPYLGMKLNGHWPQFQKLHIYSISTSGDRNWGYFRYTGHVS